MAFVQLMISGNTSYGGYLSIDGQKSFSIGDDVTYELSSGKHTFTVYTASNFDRGAKSVYNWGRTGSGSKLLNMAGDAIMKDTEGSSWSFSANLDEKGCAVITVTTRGNSFEEDPSFEVVELPEETYQMYVEHFEKLRNTPRRNKKQMGWGIGIAAACAFGMFNYVSSGAIATDGVGGLFVFIGGVAVGILLLVLGSRKIVRR